MDVTNSVQKLSDAAIKGDVIEFDRICNDLQVSLFTRSLFKVPYF
jgi:hypothetical protein